MKKTFDLIIIISSLILLFSACGGGGGSGGNTDNIPPTAPSNLIAGTAASASISLSWNASTDNVGVQGYRILRDGIFLKFVTGTSASDSEVIPGVQYCYTVYAYDAVNPSKSSNQACAAALPDLTDSAPPSVPTNLTVGGDASLSISLSWDTSTDNISVRGYKIYKNGVYLKSVAGTSTTDTGLNSNTEYCYEVSAIDGGLNESAKSIQACTTTSWTITTVDSQGDVDYASIALDSSDKVHLSYYNFTYTGPLQKVGDLKYASNFSGEWVISTVDTGGDVGAFSSIAVDSANKVHISYEDQINHHLKYATNSSGAWVANTIDNEINTGLFNSLKIDSADRAHISNYDSWSLKYATNATGTWITEIVEGGVGWYTSLGVDSSRKVHISYYDFTNADLKYATNASGSWVTTTIDSTGDVGKFTSIAMDSLGKAHIGYYDFTNADLKYATNASGSWVTTTIDSTGDVGQYTSITVDTANRVHISYEDSLNHALKYATNTSGVWKTYTIDSAAWVEGQTSLSVDSLGKMHISYRGNADLRYATNQ